MVDCESIVISTVNQAYFRINVPEILSSVYFPLFYKSERMVTMNT